MSYKLGLILVLFVALFSPYGFAAEAEKYISPDRKIQALVIPVREAVDSVRESRLDVRDASGKSLLSRSFASKDGEHGFVVARAAWTADSRFFVFSASSSGGHHPWHFPTYFYCRGDRRLRLLDDYLGPITDPDFALIAPDVIRTSKLKALGDLESVPVEAKLSKLIKQKLNP